MPKDKVEKRLGRSLPKMDRVSWRRRKFQFQPAMKLASAAEVEEQAPAAVVCQAAVQNYDWGVRGGGENGLVARMAGAAPAPGTPFA